MRYINKSVFIEACQFDGRNLPEIEEFIECSNVMSATILNNVLWLIVRTHDKSEVQRWSVMPNEFLIKDASGWITTLEEDILKNGWIPFNYKK
jgi:hypothetical protein